MPDTKHDDDAQARLAKAQLQGNAQMDLAPTYGMNPEESVPTPKPDDQSLHNDHEPRTGGWGQADTKMGDLGSEFISAIEHMITGEPSSKEKFKGK